jgi:predicted MFS family arabinose efflux permease
MHIPIGIALDRIGPKKVMPICVVMTVVGILPLIYTDIWIYPTLGRALIGMGSSGAILGVFKIIRICFDNDKFTRMLGLSVTIGLVGAIYGGQPINYLMSIFGWEFVLNIIFVVGIILAISLYISVPSYEANSEKNKNSILLDVKNVLSNAKVLAICLLAGCMVGPLEGFADVWGTEFLKITYQLNDNIASGLPSMIFLGMCFGAPFLSYLADKTQAYYPIIIMCAFVMGVGFLLVLYVKLPLSVLTIIFITIGVLCAYQILSIYKAATCVDASLFTITTACANMIIMLFGYFFHSIMGGLIQYNWDGRMYNNIPLYNSEAFIVGLSPIPIGLFIALIGYTVILLSEKSKRNAVLA